MSLDTATIYRALVDDVESGIVKLECWNQPESLPGFLIVLKPPRKIVRKLKLGSKVRFKIIAEPARDWISAERYDNVIGEPIMVWISFVGEEFE